MRIIDILVASALLGAIFGLLFAEQPRAAGVEGARDAEIPCTAIFCGRPGWLRTPAMR